MATRYWLGKATAVAQVSTAEFATYDVATTRTITIGGVAISAADSGGTLTAALTALAVLLNASTHPYFAAITWTSNATKIIGTADTAGCPFTFAGSVSGGTGTLTNAFTTTFYKHNANLEGIQQAIHERQAFDTPRALLVETLQAQYKGLPVAEKLQQHIASLASNNTFTVTTAHQPNIFTGPLYFIYKIMHTVRLADELSRQLPLYKFVPVYYMGSEDADLDELGYLNLGGQKLVWNTRQTGAVGRMKVDKELTKVLHAIEGQIAVLPKGKELVGLFKRCYTEGKTIQQATLELVNELFGAYGVVVLVLDHAKLKSAFRSVVKKELLEGFSHQMVATTIVSLSKHYKVQAVSTPPWTSTRRASSRLGSMRSPYSIWAALRCSSAARRRRRRPRGDLTRPAGVRDSARAPRPRPGSRT